MLAMLVPAIRGDEQAGRFVEGHQCRIVMEDFHVGPRGAEADMGFVGHSGGSGAVRGAEESLHAIGDVLKPERFGQNGLEALLQIGFFRSVA